MLKPFLHQKRLLVSNGQLKAVHVCVRLILKTFLVKPTSKRNKKLGITCGITKRYANKKEIRIQRANMYQGN